MLNQIVVARTLIACRCHQLSHGIELVVPREHHRLFDHTLLPAFPVIDFLFFLLDEHEMTDDVDEAVALKYLCPKIAGAITRRMLRITCSAFYLARVASAVERKEMCFLLLQSRCHVNFVGIGREMNKSA